ncbi:AbrB/MazE/SpoVT family DNA-binding domain-containing protein [Salsipaludibacter albus]|uniref:AbrB/MazE/SpoVT family DNA-binding domain-containing protein n=1 Tax=Salsipaludibacter albus TaxID=2849650 RepID=UPI001EE40597|nr:AbrB/MazE/SpoVT family DNA-binding domain-containing protein [Salsipaludibacter albus]MBY5162111.1 AbrB/MazE/SpoVT family DNA-binding domain-containing protein [Salsipaludibacter albus]
MSGTYTVSMGDRGRLVVPAELRAAGGFDPGDVLVLIDTPGGVLMVGRERLRELVRQDLEGTDLVADLLRERRAASASEDPA